MIIGIDFDGTCVTHEFPDIGKGIGAVAVLRQLADEGHKLILFTMRSDIESPKSEDDNIHPVGGTYLSDAVNWFKENNIPLWGINTNPEQHNWTHSPKAYCNLYIDDAALGCPVAFDFSISDRPFVDWVKAERMLVESGILNKK
jgi:hypothetical protein